MRDNESMLKCQWCGYPHDLCACGAECPDDSQDFPDDKEEVLVHSVVKLIDTQAIKLYHIRDTASSLACWSLTLGKNTHAVTCNG